MTSFLIVKKEYINMAKISERAAKELAKLLDGNKNFMNGTPTAKNMCLSTLQKKSMRS